MITAWCSPGMFVCPGAKECVPQDKVCNGVHDCPYGLDEVQCGNPFLVAAITSSYFRRVSLGLSRRFDNCLSLTAFFFLLFFVFSRAGGRTRRVHVDVLRAGVLAAQEERNLGQTLRRPIPTLFEQRDLVTRGNWSRCVQHPFVQVTHPRAFFLSLFRASLRIEKYIQRKRVFSFFFFCGQI